jgi:hypothetical protein
MEGEGKGEMRYEAELKREWCCYWGKRETGVCRKGREVVNE